MIGQLIAHYRITAKLGAGGMGEVYLAEDTKLDRKVALKILPSEVALQPHARQRFVSEAKAASALNHPNVCIIHSVGETGDGHPYIAMEYIEGETLYEKLRQGSLELAQIIEIGLQAADALDAAHAKGIVHRDIKPSNISIGERNRIKLLDFGLAKRAVQDALDDSEALTQLQTQPGQILGTPNYMSPEQALGKQVDHRSDIFSLGSVLYELVTGRSPFAGGSFGETVSRILRHQPEAMARFNYDTPAELERIVRKCLQKEAGRRYQSARDLHIDLENLRSEMANTGSDQAAERAASSPTGLETALPDAAGAFAPPPLEDLSKSDIYINCALIDERPLMPNRPGWVSEFQKHLATRLEQLWGEEVKILRFPMPAGAAPVPATFFDQVSSAKTMVSVVSPPFVKAEGCRKEAEVFWRTAEQNGQFLVENRPRLLKVVKMPVDHREIPPPLSDLFSRLLGFDFYDVDPATGRVRQFDDAFGAEAKERFFERIYDLAQELCMVLRSYGSGSLTEKEGADSGMTIYLAETTSDLQAERDQLKRELIEQGHRVLPNHPLPLNVNDLEGSVRECLKQSQLAVHLVGARYGLIPEGAPESIVELQNRWAAERAGQAELRRLIWMPKETVPLEETQEQFVRRLRRQHEAQTGAEIIEGILNSLKSVLFEMLRPKPAANTSGPSDREERPPQVYLICEAEDEKAAAELEDFLFEQGFEVSLPDFSLEESELTKFHRETLKDCDAVLVYYGNARRSWVDVKLRDLMKAAGYGRRQPFAAKAVYVAPGDAPRKERFRTHLAEVIRPAAAFDPKTLEPFVNRVKAAASGS